MKRFFRTSRMHPRIRSTAILLGVVSVYLFVRGSTPVERILHPVEHGFVVIGTAVGNVLSRVFASDEGTGAALAVCTERLQATSTDVAMLTDTMRTVEELEALLGYVRTSGAEGIAARIISRSLPETATVTIDKGTRDGVIDGAAVVVGNGQLFGVIAEVAQGTATVRLLANKESNIPATILGRNRTIGLVEGQEGSVLHMNYIPEDAAVEENAVVVTSGLEGALPPNIVIGVVTTIIAEDTSPFLEALVEPLYDAREWTNVLVIHL